MTEMDTYFRAGQSTAAVHSGTHSSHWCRTQQLAVAMGQWQNKTISSAFHCWRDHVVRKTSHTAKVCPSCSAYVAFDVRTIVVNAHANIAFLVLLMQLTTCCRKGQHRSTRFQLSNASLLPAEICCLLLPAHRGFVCFSTVRHKKTSSSAVVSAAWQMSHWCILARLAVYNDFGCHQEAMAKPHQEGLGLIAGGDMSAEVDEPAGVLRF